MYKRRTSWTFTKPLSTRGGIKSRVNRGRFHGSNWWSKRWIEILEGSIDSVRLARGRSYARRGQVVDIEIEPGLVTASVQGTRKKPYQIRLGFEVLSDEAKSLLLFRFRERSSFPARLLAGEMPEEMEKVFKEAGTGLFPSKSALRRFKCSCPDDAVPCKHIIAVLLLLAEVFDDDPFLLLKLRGVNREVLINLLTLETPGDNEDITYEDDEVREDADGSVIRGGSDNSAENFTDNYGNCQELSSYAKWYGEDVPEFKYNIEENERRITALEIINDFPFWRGEQPFRTALAPIYERAKSKAYEILTGEKKNSVGRPKKLF